MTGGLAGLWGLFGWVGRVLWAGYGGRAVLEASVDVSGWADMTVGWLKGWGRGCLWAALKGWMGRWECGKWGKNGVGV